MAWPDHHHSSPSARCEFVKYFSRFLLAVLAPSLQADSMQSMQKPLKLEPALTRVRGAESADPYDSPLFLLNYA